jgi:hypothetical protein
MRVMIVALPFEQKLKPALGAGHAAGDQAAHLADGWNMCKRNPRSRQSANSEAEPQSAGKALYAIALFDTGIRRVLVICRVL